MGLVGLSLARLGAQVTLTDKPALLSLLKGNVARNWLGEKPRPGYVTHLNWIDCQSRLVVHQRQLLRFGIEQNA